MEGEDIKILELTKNIEKGFYMDVGCYHPLHINNCNLLHQKGWSGINIDISKFSIDLFNHLRPKDFNINCAVSNKPGKISYFYQKELSQLTSLKKKLAEERMQGYIKEGSIESKTLTSILDNSKFKNKKIDFLNIDVEGADYEALISLNFQKYRPKVICIEITKKFEDSIIFKFLKEKKYILVWSSKSNISHIFIDEENFK
tara:strand:+ start:171 stop:773 length:603 start_codon:yes stop_codon:yes gene_type:complete